MLCVDLGESFPTSFFFLFRLRYSRERALYSLPTFHVQIAQVGLSDEDSGANGTRSDSDEGDEEGQVKHCSVSSKQVEHLSRMAGRLLGSGVCEIAVLPNISTRRRRAYIAVSWQKSAIPRSNQEKTRFVASRYIFLTRRRLKLCRSADNWYLPRIAVLMFQNNS